MRCVAEFTAQLFPATLSFNSFPPDQKSAFNFCTRPPPVALQLDAFNTKLVVDQYNALGICRRPATQQIAGSAVEFRNSLANFFLRGPVRCSYDHYAGRKRQRAVEGRCRAR